MIEMYGVYILSVDTADGRTLIIPDIHNKIDVADKIIHNVGSSVEHIIFLGDYFDSFDETPESIYDTAAWLSDSLKKDGRTHLIGNHDLNYMTPNKNLKCSGFSQDKYDIISGHNIPWERLQMFCWLGEDLKDRDDKRWLCTHAGLSNGFYTEMIKENGALSVQEMMEMSLADYENMHDESYNTRFFQVGEIRGGSAKVGGTAWCDYEEFTDIPGTRQIFGHTRGDDIRRHHGEHGAEHICLDTMLNHYAVYEHDTGTINVIPAKQ